MCGAFLSQANRVQGMPEAQPIFLFWGARIARFQGALTRSSCDTYSNFFGNCPDRFVSTACATLQQSR